VVLNREIHTWGLVVHTEAVVYTGHPIIGWTLVACVRALMAADDQLQPVAAQERLGKAGAHQGGELGVAAMPQSLVGKSKTHGHVAATSRHIPTATVEPFSPRTSVTSGPNLVPTPRCTFGCWPGRQLGSDHTTSDAMSCVMYPGGQGNVEPELVSHAAFCN